MSFDIDTYLESQFEHVLRTRDDMHYYQDGIAVPFLLANPFSALFVDLGLGKTIISLTTIVDLLDSMSFERALVAGPLRVVSQTWPDEIPQWEHTACMNAALIRDEDFQEAVRVAGQIARAPIVAEAREEAIRRGIDPDLDPSLVREVIREFVKLRADEIKRARLRAARTEIRKATMRNPATIHLVNREQIEQLVYAWGRDWPYDVVIIDESSSLKDHKTKRFKALKAVKNAGLIKRLHELTATPAAEGYMGLFAQMYLLDGGKRLGKNITAYRERYFSRGYDGFSWKLRPGADEEIAAKISDICLTLKREDYLKDLKEPVFNPRYVKLSSDELKLYKRFERDFVAELDDGTVVEAETAATLSGKLLQLASGFIYDNDRLTHHIHDHKIEELSEIVEEACGKPLVVVYWFKPSLERLKKAFPKAVVMDPEAKCVKPWNQGKIDMLLVHPASAGHGLNLQYGGHHMVFFDIPWSLELYLQVIGRLDRQGQEFAVVLHHIIAKGTIDEYVVECLREKRDMQDALFRFLKAASRRMLNRCA
ncbi:helicase [Burkholderia phage vB_BceS_AH2]|uniref:Helicase n=1 Tax=Burkholderia phage vB_BceS_AH2 TaxID=1133022 RepID=I6NST0_9CAUD|nr:DNA helicase [Burkholderia phage vB_BceS_AH2]AEY69581.1 helicase [Burkholderia phage vB_BceS_AH2]